MIETMRNAGITTEQAAAAFSELAAVAAESIDYETEVKNIRSNPSLRPWEKRRIIKDLQKMRAG